MGVCVKGCEFGKKKIKIKIDVQNCRFCPNQNCAINVDWDERIIFLSDKIRIFSEYFYQIYDILHFFFASDFHRKLDYSSKTQQKKTNKHIHYLPSGMLYLISKIQWRFCAIQTSISGSCWKLFSHGFIFSTIHNYQQS